jgi:hypothetical protein
MLAPIVAATVILLGASLLYKNQWLGAFSALVLYVATLVMLYMRRPDS